MNAAPDGLGVLVQFVLLWPLCLMTGWGLGWWNLRWLRRAAQTGPAPTQFRVGDFLVLLVVLFAAGWIPVLREEPMREGKLLLDMLFLHSLLIAWWWWGLRLLARAHVRAMRARTVALGLAIPLACGGALVFVYAPIAGSGVVLDALNLQGEVQGRAFDPAGCLLWATKVVPFWILLGFLSFWCTGRLARWVVRHRVDGEQEEDQPS